MGRTAAVVLAGAALALSAGAGALSGLGADRQEVSAAVPSTSPSAEPSPGPVSPSPQAAPSTSPQAVPSPSMTSAPSPSAAPTPPPLAEGFAELAQEVADVRGLPAPQPLDVRVVSPAEIGDVYTRLAFDDYDPADLERDRRVLVALRLLAPDLDLRAAIEALFRGQVIGLYVPETDTLYVGSEDATPGAALGVDQLGAYRQVTAAHELTHALQDAAFDLERLRDLPDEASDESLALLALIEGDAVLSQQAWQTRFQDARERTAAVGEAAADYSPPATAIPPYLQASLDFPYTAGFAFAAALAGQGTAAVDAAFAAPPTSTEQILHPERYLAGEGPSPVPALGDPGAGWSAPTSFSFGEFDLRQLFAALGSETVDRVGTGWGGGLVTGWERGSETAVGLALSFDTPQDAAQACESLPRWYTAAAGGQSTEVEGVLRGPADVLAFRCEGLDVAAAIAADQAVAEAIAVR